ncbi:MAG: transaldolase, partial [Elusimicrobia bacterium]|nr:transaldolase [Elusimicrobiota bacterium]
GADRVFVFMKLAGGYDKTTEDKLQALEAAGHPVLRFELDDVLDLAREFFRWELATTVCGTLLGINPFGEPNVEESKANTQNVLSQFIASGKLPEDPPLWEENNFRVSADERTESFLQDQRMRGASIGQALSAYWATAQRGGYLALMAYVTPDEANHNALQLLRHQARDAGRAAATLGYGPGLLHSTGQLHKGGANSGLFLQIVADDQEDPPIPEASYGLSTLKRAQALGDFQALKKHGRRVIRLHLSVDVAGDLDKLNRSFRTTAVRR